MMSFTQFWASIQTMPVVSVSRDVVLDMETSMSMMNKLKLETPCVFLEGAAQSERYGLSYLGLDPFIRVVGYPSYTQLIYANREERVSDSLFSVIRQLKNRYQLDKKNVNAVPDFRSGIMGYIHYEAVQFLEAISFPNLTNLNQPLAQLILPQIMIVFDNVTHRVSITRNIYQEKWLQDEAQARELYQTIEAELEAWIERLRGSVPSPLGLLIDPVPASEAEIEAIALFSKADFLEAVKKAKRYIDLGHVFQIQISRRVAFKPACSALSMYRFLRYSNPSPFMFFLQFDGYQLLGSSPEILVGVQDQNVIIRPLAGTRKRYASGKTESEIVKELLSDEKERAEHVMLVDLARNDLSRACAWGSVKVNELMSIEKYRHVMHIVSDVSGTLRPGCDSVDAFQYGFPAGTVSGTPKVRSMEIISELEPVSREFYAGGIVFFDFYDNLKSTLVIRSIAVHDGVAYTQAAAGIVADSIPEMEFFETQNKMRSALQAMMLKGEGLL